MKSKTDLIVFGGGCFWCTEAVFSMFRGIVKTTPGYAGGTTSNPTYEGVCSGSTGHAEVLQIQYDPKIIPVEVLLEIFFAMHDPTSLNRQDADVGSQYRSVILCTNSGQEELAKKFIKQIQKNFDKPIVTEVKMLERFYPAEHYHKNYYEKNPHRPYCLLVIGPKMKKIKNRFAALLR